MRLHRPTLSPFALAAIALAAAAPLPAETTQCTAITSLPYTISSSGVYCLTADLDGTALLGTAITIATNNVTLDLNGHRLAGSVDPATTATGIRAASRGGIIVRNGTIRGFQRAVDFSSGLAGPCARSVIEGITFERSRFTAVDVNCLACIVRGNLFYNIGGSTSSPPDGVGILVVGKGNVIRDNDIMTVRGREGDTGHGVWAFNSSDNTVIEGNRITNTHMGVFAAGSNVVVSDNRLTSMAFGIYYPAGSTGKYRDNLTSGVTTPFVGGTSAGNNN